MRPILFQIGGIPIWSHDVFVTLGVAVAVVVSWEMARRRGRADQNLLWIIAGGLLLAAIFSRFGLVFRYLQQADEPTISGFIRYGGRTVLGGLAGGYLGVVLTKRLIGYRRATGDLFAPAVGQCPACLTGTAMHPSFLYEIAFLVLAAGTLFAASRRRRPFAPWMVEGDLFKLFLLAYAVFRFFVEFVRDNPVMGFGLSGSQLMVLPSSVLLALYFLRRRQRALAPLAVIPG